MSRYIDADKLINKIFPIGMVHDGQYTIGAKAIKIAIDKIPTADVVEVVRCKDCRMFCENKEAFVSYCKRGLHNIHANPDDFCSHGERRST